MTSVLRDRKSSEKPPEERRSQPHQVKGAHIITERIEVGVPAEVAFDLWTRYDKWQEVFKKESASAGRGSDDSQQKGGSPPKDQQKDRSSDEQQEGGGDITVTAKIGPSTRHWSVEITDMDPPHRLGWRAKGGLRAKGVTSFHSLDERLTKVMVEIEYRPSGLFETVGNFFRMQRRRVRRDLRLFKNYAELRPDEHQDRSGKDRSAQGGAADPSQGNDSQGPADNEEGR